jgi:hypothetical protein
MSNIIHELYITHLVKTGYKTNKFNIHELYITHLVKTGYTTNKFNIHELYN